MTNNQKETVAIVATVVTMALLAYGLGKVTGSVWAQRMVHKFDKAVDQKVAN